MKHIFGFDYIWEVYKKVEQRKYGYYVCPLLYKGWFIGRIEGERKGDTLNIFKVWVERERLDAERESSKRDEQAILDEWQGALEQAIQRHAENCDMDNYSLPPQKQWILESSEVEDEEDDGEEDNTNDSSIEDDD